MTIRLVVFDLDGTLLGSDNRLSAYTLGSLERARDAEVTIVAASGRSCWATDLVLEGTLAIRYAICSGGAVLYDRKRGEIIERHSFAPGHLDDLYELARRLPGVCFAWETQRGIVPEEEFRFLGTRPGDELDELLASPYCELPPERDGRSISQQLVEFGPTVRILLAHRTFRGEALAQALHPLPHRMRLASSSAMFIEVTRDGVDKGTALASLCATHGFEADEVMAFGDHLNDIAMLDWAGEKIAMRDAHAKVRSMATRCTEFGHDADGAARELDKLVADL